MTTKSEQFVFVWSESTQANVREYTVLTLRREGYSAWQDATSIYTDAPRSLVLFVAGNGLALV